MTTMSVSDARKNFPSIIDRASNNLEEFTIVKNGQVKAVIMSAEEFEGWKETIEIMGNPELMQQIAEGEEAIKRGEVVPLDDLYKD